MIEFTVEFNETFILQELIKITVYRTKNRGVVKLGIDAPRNIIILREELYLKINAKLEDDK